jgi:hypothetical protein
MGGFLMRVAPVRALARPFVVVRYGRQLAETPSHDLPSKQVLLFHCKSMTNEIADALARIDRALTRIEGATAKRAPATPSAPDGRYEKLRARTQAALAELDTVIARVSATERV